MTGTGQRPPNQPIRQTPGPTPQQAAARDTRTTAELREDEERAREAREIQEQATEELVGPQLDIVRGWDWAVEPHDWSTVPTYFTPEAYNAGERNSTTEERRALAAIKVLNRAGYLETEPDPPASTTALGSINFGWIPLKATGVMSDPFAQKPQQSEPLTQAIIDEREALAEKGLSPEAKEARERQKQAAAERAQPPAQPQAQQRAPQPQNRPAPQPQPQPPRP